MMQESSVEVNISCMSQLVALLSYISLYTAPCVDGAVQLIGDSRYNGFGRLEVCINSTWGAVCGQRGTHMDASVVCRQLGFSPHGKLHYLFRYICIPLLCFCRSNSETNSIPITVNSKLFHSHCQLYG